MAPAVLEREPITPLERDRPALSRTGFLLDRLADRQPAGRPKLVSPTGEEIELPDALFDVLRQAVRYLKRGDSVMIAPVHKELTSQEAADLLNVSRPYLIRLLDQGRIPFTKTGKHRRVRLGDLLAFKQIRDRQRRAGLARLAELSQELGLYDEE